MPTSTASFSLLSQRSLGKEALGQVARVLKDCGFVCHRFFFDRG